jgi:hypothetical protein
MLEKDVFPKLAHEGTAVFVIALSESDQRGVGSLPETLGEREVLEAVSRGIPKVLLECAAELACPDFVQGRLDDSVDVPAVGGQNFECFQKHSGRGYANKIEMFGSNSRYEASFEPQDS